MILLLPTTNIDSPWFRPITIFSSYCIVKNDLQNILRCKYFSKKILRDSSWVSFRLFQYWNPTWYMKNIDCHKFPDLGVWRRFQYSFICVTLLPLPPPPPCLILPTPPLFSFLLPLHPTPLTLLMVYNKSTHPNIGAVQKTSIKWRMAQHWRIPNVAKYINTS